MFQDPGWTFSTAFGKEQYSAPDFLADGLFDLAWPGYRNAGYYRDASFELSPTPYGDVFDVLLSDVSAELLSRYDTIVVAHALVTRPLITRQRLARFVQQGGQLLITHDSLRDLGPGATIENVVITLSAHSSCSLHSSNTMQVNFSDDSSSPLTEPTALSLCAVTPPPGAQILATATTAGGETVPLAFRTRANDHGGSMIFVALGNYGVATEAVPVGKACTQDQPTESPQPLARSLDRLASSIMAEQALFDLGGRASNLSWVVKHVSPEEYLLGVSNTQLTEQPLNVKPTFGELVSVTEVDLDDSEKTEPGYLPHGFQGRDIGRSSSTSVAGADFRMLRVVVKPTPSAVRVLPHSVFPRAPSKVWLRLGAGEGDLKAAIQKRVGFRQLFEGVLLDSSYVSTRTLSGLQADADWMAKQRLSIGVDLSPAILMFPGLRLGNFSSSASCNERLGVCGDGAFFAKSLATIRDVMQKCATMNCGDVLLTLHKAPELGPNQTVVAAEMTATVQLLAAEAAALQPSVRLHLRQSSKNTILAGTTAASQLAWVKKTSKSLLFAPNTGMAAVESADLESPGMLTPKSLLLVDGVSDLYLASRHGTETAPVLGTSEPTLLAKIEQYIEAARRANSTIVLDATYVDLLQEEKDTLFLEHALRGDLPPSPPPPVPPGPPPPGSHCYSLGTAVKGICTVQGRKKNEMIVMGCPPSHQSCYADEMKPSGQWAGAYGDHFSAALNSGNSATAVTRLSINSDSKWVITVTTSLGNGVETSLLSPLFL
jgi:hypothetical protein